MMIRTIEDNFDYQTEQIFETFVEDYKEEQESRKEDDLEVQTFSEYLWDNLKELGRAFYEKVNEYMDIDEATEKYNTPASSTS